MKRTMLSALPLAASLVLGAAAPALVSAPAAAEDIRVASHMADTSGIIAHAKIFADAVNERYPGKFNFKFYPSAQLGKETAIIGQTKAGTLEMVSVGSGPLKLDDRLGIFDLPWLFDSREHAIRAVKGDLGEAVRKIIEEDHNMVVLGIYEIGPRHVVNKVRPIVEPKDMEGMKIRATGSSYRLDGFKAMGANPVPVPWSETFTALQTGVVDGAEATHPGFYEAKLDEVTKYLSLTNHVWTPSFLLMSRDFFDELSEEEQKAFRQIGRDITDKAFAASAEIDEKFLDELRKTMEVNEVDIPAFVAKAKGVQDAYIKEFGDDWIKLVDAARATN